MFRGPTFTAILVISAQASREADFMEQFGRQQKMLCPGGCQKGAVLCIVYFGLKKVLSLFFQYVQTLS